MDTSRSVRSRLKNKSALELLGIKKRKSVSDGNAASPTPKEKKTAQTKGSKDKNNMQIGAQQTKRKSIVSPRSTTSRTNNQAETNSAANNFKATDTEGQPAKPKPVTKVFADNSKAANTKGPEGSRNSKAKSISLISVKDKATNSTGMKSDVQEKCAEVGEGSGRSEIPRRGRPRKVVASNNGTKSVSNSKAVVGKAVPLKDTNQVNSESPKGSEVSKKRPTSPQRETGESTPYRTDDKATDETVESGQHPGKFANSASIDLGRGDSLTGRCNTEPIGHIVSLESSTLSQIAVNSNTDVSSSKIEEETPRSNDEDEENVVEMEQISEPKELLSRNKRAGDVVEEFAERCKKQKTSEQENHEKLMEIESSEEIIVSKGSDEELTTPRAGSRQRKLPHKFKNFDIEDVTNVITLSASGIKKKQVQKTPKVVDDDLDVWKIMQIKREQEEISQQEGGLTLDQVINVFGIDQAQQVERTEQFLRKPKADVSTELSVKEMSQEDAVNLLMDVANTSRQRLASTDLEGVTLSLKEVPGDHVEISMQEETSYQEEDPQDPDEAVNFAACEVLSKVAEDAILEHDGSSGSKVIVVEGVEPRKVHGLRQGTLLTWRVHSLEEGQQNLTAEELQQAMTLDQGSSSDTYKVEVTGPESFDLSKRAKPGKNIILSSEHEALLSKLQPDDDISNHIRVKLLPDFEQKICKYCNTVIQNRHQFRSHIKLHRDIVTYKPWKCPLCDYRADIKASIARHINIHGAMKPFICNACGRGFNFRQKLLLHMKYHLDIRDRECPICSLAFHEYKILKGHMKSVHNITSGFESLKRNVGCDPEMQKFWQKKMKEYTSDMKEFRKEQKARGIIIEFEPQSDEGEGEGNGQNDEDTEEAEVDAQQEGEPSQSESTPEDNQDSESDKKDKSPVDQEGSLSEEKEMIDQTECQIDTKDDHSDQKDGDTNQSEDEAEKVMLCLQGGKEVEMEMKGGKVVVPRMFKSHFLNRRQGTSKTSRTIICTENFRKGFKPGKKRSGQTKKGAKKASFKMTSVEALFGEYCTVVPATGVEITSYYKCKLCTEKPVLFRNKTSFLHHLEKVHPAVKPWKCDLCDFTSRLRSGLISHMKQHNPEFSEQCDICGRQYHDKRKFLAHQRSHLNLREHSCTMCDKRFNERCDMLKHIRRVHATVFPYKCQKCDRAFSERPQLKRHMDQHNGGRQQCEVCHKFYRNQSSLQQHMKSHTCMFHCEICNKSFSSYSGFMAHKVMHDESYEGYKCTVCPQVLHTKGSLKRHLDVVHSKKRDWICTAENCPKSYKSKKDLLNHMLSHSLALHRCPHCPFTCKRPESIRVHMIKHWNTKPFKCHLCKKEYTQKQALEIHIRHHTGQMEGRCELCGREFLTKYGLMLHMKRRHIIKEPAELTSTAQMEALNNQVFVCDECEAVFSSQDNLAIHILAQHMTQDWSTLSSNEGVAVEVEVDGSSAETSVSPQADASGSPPVKARADSTNGSVRKYVSLLRKKLAPSSDNPMQQTAPDKTPSKENVTVQHVFFESAPTQKNFATVINPDTNEETLITIGDPPLNQELFISMPTTNFENFLPSSNIPVSSDLGSGQFRETYITINKDGDIVSNPPPMMGEIVTTVLDLDTEIAPEMVEEQFVTETVEIPLKIEDVVTLTQDGQEEQTVTYNHVANAGDGSYVILRGNNPSQLAENL